MPGRTPAAHGRDTGTQHRGRVAEVDSPTIHSARYLLGAADPAFFCMWAIFCKFTPKLLTMAPPTQKATAMSHEYLVVLLLEEL